MSNNGHRQTKVNGQSLADHVRPTIMQESQLLNVPMPTDEQIALVASALRMHTTMLHASTYDRSELGNPDKETTFYPVESSIGRWLRDAAREVLDEHKRQVILQKGASDTDVTRKSNEETIRR